MKIGLTITLIISAVTLFLTSCDKDKFETIPKIAIKNVSSYEVRNAQKFTITVEFQDKEGDVTDSIFIFQEILNENQAGTAQQFETFRNKIPEYPSSKKGELTARFVVNSAPDTWEQPLRAPLTAENDTCIFTIQVKDAGGNLSLPVTTEKVVFLKQ